MCKLMLTWKYSTPIMGKHMSSMNYYIHIAIVIWRLRRCDQYAHIYNQNQTTPLNIRWPATHIERKCGSVKLINISSLHSIFNSKLIKTQPGNTSSAGIQLQALQHTENSTTSGEVKLLDKFTSYDAQHQSNRVHATKVQKLNWKNIVFTRKYICTARFAGIWSEWVIQAETSHR